MRWDGAPQITPAPMGVLGVLRACQRGAAILLVIGFGFLTLLLCRVPERVIAGPLRRPVTARITQIVCVFVCVILGLK
ncbi:MAG: 1-acyl-sn-glycerol-3-phosphate acyltransferase, partial [Paracoccaceae bacterium]